MTRPYLANFAGEPLPLAQAWSEPFVQPRAFAIGADEGEFEFDPDVLIGIGTLYMGPARMEGAPINYALSLDPNGTVGQPVAGKLFMEGYRESLDVFHGLIDLLIESRALAAEVLQAISLRALDLVAGNPELRSVASVQVTGTPEKHSGALIVRRKIAEEMTLVMRDALLGSGPDEPLTRRVPQDTRREILTQARSTRHFGMFAVTPLLPRAEDMQRMVDQAVAS